MSILTDFYTITDFKEETVGKYSVSIRLNAEHAIFNGHFPNNPVTPGVCMMQIIKDLSEQIVEKSLFLSKASNVKFMALINPVENPILQLEMEVRREDGDTVKVKNVSSFGDTVALKMTNVYKIKQ